MTQASANAAISIESGVGAVAGSLLIDGSVVSFKPHGSLCFDQDYTVSIANTVQTADATKLDEARSFSFRIPDGAWQDAVALGPSAATVAGPNVDMDLEGNALAAWEKAPSQR